MTPLRRIGYRPAELGVKLGQEERGRGLAGRGPCVPREGFKKGQPEAAEKCILINNLGPCYPDQKP